MVLQSEKALLTEAVMGHAESIRTHTALPINLSLGLKGPPQMNDEGVDCLPVQSWIFLPALLTNMLPVSAGFCSCQDLSGDSPADITQAPEPGVHMNSLFPELILYLLPLASSPASPSGCYPQRHCSNSQLMLCHCSHRNCTSREVE